MRRAVEGAESCVEHVELAVAPPDGEGVCGSGDFNLWELRSLNKLKVKQQRNKVGTGSEKN